jgi:hypothetical protein
MAAVLLILDLALNFKPKRLLPQLYTPIPNRLRLFISQVIFRYFTGLTTSHGFKRPVAEVCSCTHPHSGREVMRLVDFEIRIRL